MLAIGFLVFTGLQHTSSYFYTVSEILASPAISANDTIRVGGEVMPGSVVKENGGLTMRFSILDQPANKTLPVIYEGAVPDTFKEGADVVAEGRLSAGVLQASTLMPECASRYEPAATGQSK